MKKTSLIYAVCLITLTITNFLFASPLSANELTSEEFLDRVRRNHPTDTWGILEGEVNHRRRGSETISSQIRFAVRFTPTRILAKITLGNDESYTVGQPYSETAPTIIADDKSLAVANLANFGLRPEDLTMTFLYWKFIKELKPSSVRGINCRVFILRNPSTDEEVKAFIGANYFYPIEVQWLKSNEDTPYRTCFINSFKEVGKLWTPDSFSISGPGWRTNVDFASDKIQLGYTSEGVPKDLF